MKNSDGFFATNDPRIDDVEEFGITNANNAFHAAGASVVGAQGGLLGDLFEYKLKRPSDDPEKSIGAGADCANGN